MTTRFKASDALGGWRELEAHVRKQLATFEPEYETNHSRGMQQVYEEVQRFMNEWEEASVGRRKDPSEGLMNALDMTDSERARFKVERRKR